MLLAVDPDKVHIKQAGEGFLYEVALILAHETLVNEHAGQLIANGPADKARGHGGIHAAGQTQNDLLVADTLFQSLHGVLNEGIHLPVAGAAADAVEEVFQHQVAVLAVGHLRVRLNGVDFLGGVFHGRHRALVRPGGNREALGHLIDPVGVAHPHYALGGNLRKKQGILLGDGHVNFAVLGGFGGNDGTARHPGGELAAVADTENRNSQLQHRGVVVGGGHIEDAVGAAGENNAPIAPCLNLLRGNGVVLLNLRIDVEIPNSSGDQLIILTAEV